MSCTGAYSCTHCQLMGELHEIAVQLGAIASYTSTARRDLRSIQELLSLYVRHVLAQGTVPDELGRDVVALMNRLRESSDRLENAVDSAPPTT